VEVCPVLTLQLSKLVGVEIARSPGRWANKILLGVEYFPIGIVFEHSLWGVVVPRITIAAFFRDFVHVVVNALVPVAKNRTVSADFIIAGLNRSVTRCGNEATSVVIIKFESQVVDFGFFKPCRSGIYSRDDLRAGSGLFHQKHHEFRAFATGL